MATQQHKSHLLTPGPSIVQFAFKWHPPPFSQSLIREQPVPELKFWNPGRQLQLLWKKKKKEKKNRIEVHSFCFQFIVCVNYWVDLIPPTVMIKEKKTKHHKPKCKPYFSRLKIVANSRIGRTPSILPLTWVYF